MLDISLQKHQISPVTGKDFSRLPTGFLAQKCDGKKCQNPLRKSFFSRSMSNMNELGVGFMLEILREIWSIRKYKD
jgi:hypothetical protein